MLSFNIVGAGQVGRVLGQRFIHRGVFQLGQVMNRTLSGAQQAIAFIGAGTAVAEMNLLHPADITMLTVPDDQIEIICQRLAACGLFQTGSIVFHCSGAKSSSVLAAASQAGASVASLHPVRSFADVTEIAASFKDTIFSVEGEAAALQILLPALQAIEARVVQIDAASKLLYHAGSVFASNYLVSLIETALQAYQAAGIPPDIAKAMAEPLARQTLDNVFRLGTAAALTGPIARGDLVTAARQQSVVADWDNQAGLLYQAFMGPTITLAERKKKLYSEK
jgi:predicted short-subunit dehydrogenase-like oxidoreductase (DUF2520 family)